MKNVDPKEVVEKWMSELVFLLGAGEVEKAREYVKSLPIDKSAKEALLSHLP